MKKSDLKTGMVVETRDGFRELIVLNFNGMGENYTVNNGVFGNLDQMRRDLTSKVNREYDIMKVYAPDNPVSSFNLDPDNLIWERVKNNGVTELTLEDVAELAGKDVSEIKIIK